MPLKQSWLLGIALSAALCLAGCGGSSKPPSVAVTASTTTVDGTDTVALTATVTNDKNSAGVTWTVSGGGTLSNQTISSVTYTAPTATTAAQTATVTATSVANPAKNAVATLTIPAAPSITLSSLPAAAVGTLYSVTLTGTGGITPYKWSVSTGTLPAWASLNSSTGVVTGTPHATDATTTALTFKLTDSGTATALTATKALSLVVNAAPAIAFTGAMPATGTYNVAYAGSAAATGGVGALTYSKSGTWPAWLSLNTSSGAVTGTPPAVGTFTFGVTAADAYGDSNTQGFSILVSYPALIVPPAEWPV